MKLLTVVGARPQFIKAAMVSRAIAVSNENGDHRRKIQEVLVHTGQHYDNDMSTVFFEELALSPPAFHLGISSGPHGQQTGRMLEGLERVMRAEQPDYVLVYGDTNSTLAGGLAASKLQIPIAHVEAGLRSYNRRMPEEINRVITDHLSTLLFCPTAHAVKNLSCEGIAKGVHLVGDVMAEMLELCLPMARARSDVLERLSLSPREYYLVTFHRAENTDDEQRISSILKSLPLMRHPVVFPCHPRTRKMIERFGLASVLDNSLVQVIQPVSYLDMLRLEAEAALILTDSGGVQKEAYWLSVPCITLRDETEWVETLEGGWNVLAGTGTESILVAIRTHLGNKRQHSQSACQRNMEASRHITTQLVAQA
ncbi:MAG: non-hydrolyzing UDP-N-acetylglucosamine 2-epimerase [Nitrospiraceae bacterium]